LRSLGTGRVNASRPAAAFAALALALIVVAFLALRPAPTPGPVLRDFEAYYAAGVTWRDGGDPYAREIWRVQRHIPGVVSSRDELLPFVGPPHSLPLWAALAGLPYGAAVVVWAALLAIATGLFGFCVARLAGLREPVDVAALVLLGAAFGPLTSALALGQVALIACAGVVATTLALEGTRTRIAVAIVAAWLAALQPNLAAPLVARLSDRRAFLALGIAAALATAAAVATFRGLPGVFHYLDVLRAHAAAERTIAIQCTLAAIAYGFGAPEGLALRIALAAGVLVVAVTAWILVTRRDDPAWHVAVASAALPLVQPFAHEHDFALALFPAVLCLRRTSALTRLVVVAATVLIAVDWLGLTQRPSGLAQSIALAAAAAVAAMLLARSNTGVWILAAALLAALGVTCIGIWAASHPLGVWPYALDLNFHAPLELDAAGVWRLEQVQSGLATPNAAAAALRALSLGGCALLWATALTSTGKLRR
jgi:Glycosyltransferase family 87